MWDENELALDEPTRVRERPEPPPSTARPFLLWNSKGNEELEIVEVVELGSRPPPPPRRRAAAAPPPAPSLGEATPTRPGELGYTNELLFVEVTPSAFTLEQIVESAREPAAEGDPSADRGSISLDATTFDLLPPRRPDRVVRGLLAGAVGAVLLACVSYVHGPIAAEPAPRSAFLDRSAVVVTATLGPDVLDEEVPEVRNRRDARRRAPRRHAAAATSAVATDDRSVLADETGAGAEPAARPKTADEEGGEDASVRDRLTEALAPPFNVGAAKAALAGAAGNASACGDGEATGSARVSVTFGHDGRVTAAAVDGSAPWASSSVGSCIVGVMRKAAIPAYSGEVVTVLTRVTLR